MREPLNWTTFNNFLWHHHDDLSWKTKEDTCARAYGFMELNVGTMLPKWRTAMFTTLGRGYRSVEKPPWVRILIAISMWGPIPYRISYIGRQGASLFYPRDKAEEYCEQLNACYMLETETQRRPFTVYDSVDDCDLMCVRAKIGQKRRGKGIAPVARFARLRQVMVDQHHDCREHREQFVAYVEGDPIVKIPFSSHDSDWRRR